MTEKSNFLLTLTASVARILPDWVKRGLYRSGPLARGIRRALNRSAPLGLTIVSVAAGSLKDKKMLLDLQTEKDYWLGTYEPELQKAVKDWLKPGWTVYDVGANIGYVSLILAHAVGEKGRIYSFEAFPENIERLQKNVDLNDCNESVQVIPVAVVDEPRDVHFLVGPSNGMGKVDGSAGRSDVPYSGSMTVPGISLDHFVYDQGYPAPQAVKIDIEGGEVLALPGMTRLLKDQHPLLFLELHGQDAARMAWDILGQAGYSLRRMQPGYPQVPSLDALEWKTYLVGVP